MMGGVSFWEKTTPSSYLKNENDPICSCGRMGNFINLALIRAGQSAVDQNNHTFISNSAGARASGKMLAWEVMWLRMGSWVRHF